MKLYSDKMKPKFEKIISGIKRLFSVREIEALIWLTAIFLLAISDPYNPRHFTLFLPSILFDIPSPGYNLGHSIAFIFRGEFTKSFEAHPLGIITLFLLIYRIIYILKNSKSFYTFYRS